MFVLFVNLLFVKSIISAPIYYYYYQGISPYGKIASNRTVLDNFKSAPDLLPTYGHLSDKAYGKPSRETGFKVAKWRPDTHKMFPEELGSYEKGDILIPRERPADLRNGLVEPSSRWPGGYIPYWIAGHFSDDELNVIYSSMEVLHQLTCIHFVPWNGENDYLVIENTDTGCWSSVGRIGGKQIINLQSPACVWGIGTPLHEFMHTIGFFHEQSRPERDNFVQIFWHNILPGQNHNFQKFPPSYILSQVPYDFNSVMHYSGNAFSKSNKLMTMKSKIKGKPIGQHDFLSERDVKKIRLMYKCSGNIANV